ncbi:phosphohydrolase [Solemya velum gill symbiont]|uniref:Phosphohydrolase n=1 Tax=Solemya velum gill symbiont TaxID=2340 RepID=A0A0B0H8M3_SOVGS|nr:metallophosphoesterase [Solemya velum gill symbiont]KHF25007.1 phosphohydrolase [Solemya velum gill symbiont]
MSINRQLLFVTIFLSVLALTNLYVYRRFFLRLSPRLHLAGAVLMSVIMLGELVFVIDMVVGIFPESLAVYLLLSTFIGASFMLFVIALVYDLAVSVSRRVPFDQERRRTIKVIFDTAMLIAAASYLWRGFIQGTKQPVVNDVVVRIKDFPFNGLSIVQLTDVHIGRTIKRDFLEEIVRRTNEMQPDIVVITGDLFDLPPGEIIDELQPLAKLDAPTYFVTGNHEYFHGVEPVLKTVESLGIKALTNKAVQFGDGEKHFNLVGFNDLTGGRFGIRPPNVEEAYSQIDESISTIVLSHQPKSISLVEERRCDLMLSGHTHGGQIFPFGWLVKIDQPYLAGLYEHLPGKQIFVSRGTGYWGPPLRVLAPSEISRIVITRA